MNTALYIDIAKRLRAKTDVKTIDIYNGQYEDPTLYNSYATPAVFVEFLNQQVTDINQRIAYRTGLVRLHCVMSYQKDTANIDKFTADQQAAMLKPYLFPEQIESALEGWKADNALSTFELANDDYLFSVKGIIVQMRDYTYQDYDKGAYIFKDYVPVDATLSLSGDIVKEID